MQQRSREEPVSRPGELRVALLTNFIPPYRLPVLEELQRRIGELRIFVSTPMEQDRAWQVEWGALNVTIQRTFTTAREYRDPFGFSRTLQLHVPYDTLPQLMRYAPDAVISAELGMRSLQAAMYRALRPRSSLLIWATLSEHSERAWGAGRRALRHIILRAADGVLVNGESGARYIRRFNVPDHCIHRVNQPVDVRLFSATRREKRQAGVLRMIYVGALTPRKGLTGFLQTVARWARGREEHRVEIWWAGDGPDRAKLAATALPGNLSQRFVGELPYREIPQVYAQADVLLFPTLMDEWGLVVNEAMASGLPVLGSIYSQAVEELVEDGVTGWTFDARREASVMEALDRLFAATPAMLDEMQVAARRRIAGLTPAAASERIAWALRQSRGDRRQARRGRELQALMTTKGERRT